MDIITKQQAIELGHKRYYTGISCKNNHMSERLVSDGSCMECKREIRHRMIERDPSYFSRSTSKWNKENPERAKQHHADAYKNNRSKRLLGAKKWRENNPKQYILTRAKSGAKKRNLECTISLQDFNLPTHCPILGLELIYQTVNSKLTDATASLDRIDSTLGYIPGNVCVISWRANWLKSNATLDELRSIVTYIETMIELI